MLLALVAPKSKKFYEILSGAVHTYADLEWTQDHPHDTEVVAAFEQIFWAVAVTQLGLADSDGEILWSTSFAGNKGFFALQVRV